MHIDFEQLQPSLVGKLVERCRLQRARGIDQALDRVLLVDAINERADLLTVGNVDSVQF
ncbi:hypothetical protein D3C85_1547690 [compost metagenome]